MTMMIMMLTVQEDGYKDAVGTDGNSGIIIVNTVNYNCSNQNHTNQCSAVQARNQGKIKNNNNNNDNNNNNAENRFQTFPTECKQ